MDKTKQKPIERIFFEPKTGKIIKEKVENIKLESKK